MSSDIESRIRETGYRLYDFMEGESGSIFSRQYWVGKLFEWCMHNEAFKVQMFRFIDVFPYLKDADSVISHIQQYFSDPALNFPSAVNWGIKYVAPSWMTSRIIAGASEETSAEWPGSSLPGLLRKTACRCLKNCAPRGMAFSIDLLGEAVVSENEAQVYLERYLELFDFLDAAQRKWRPLGGVSGDLDWGHSPRVNVSIKTSAMYSQINACAFEPLHRKIKGAFASDPAQGNAGRRLRMTLIWNTMG